MASSHKNDEIPPDTLAVREGRPWEAQLRKGAVEMAALAALWNGRLYGLEIIRFLEQHSQLVLAEGTVYPILNRLKAEAMLTSEWVEADAGHPRKYYSLTNAGRQRLRFHIFRDNQQRPIHMHHGPALLVRQVAQQRVVVDVS